MNAKKLSSDEVPGEFLKWLLSMGCPAEKVPSVDKMSRLCRGPYTMVWKSLIEHVHSKNIIREKRLQVFIDDVRQCKKRSPFSERNQSVVEPVQLTLWKQKVESKKKLLEAEKKLAKLHSDLNILTDKMCCALSKKNLIQIKVKNLQRRTWLLQQVCSELEAKKKHLEETQNIANSLCNIDREDDLENKVQKCLALLRKKLTSQGTNTSGITINESESEEILASLVKYRGDALFAQLNEKRAAIIAEFKMANSKEKENVMKNLNSVQSIVAHTAFLHSSLALESLKNKQHIKQAQGKLAANIELLGDCLSTEACELLVLHCERASVETRVGTLRELLDDVTARRGVFGVPGDSATDDGRAISRLIASVDKDIESTRDNIVRCLTALAVTERKVSSVENCLKAVFNAFHCDDVPENKFKGIQFEFPQETISTLRKYFTETRQAETNKENLSLDFDVSDTSVTLDNNRMFSNELKIYLNRFQLEKNRKIILDSGDKIWISETLQSSLARLQQGWLDRDVTPLLCPSVSLKHNLLRIINTVRDVDGLRCILKGLNSGDVPNIIIDIKDKAEAEERNIDKLKKKIAENMSILQKTKKNLEIAEENLLFWSRDEMKKYISTNRTIDGKTYIDYQNYYTKAILNK